MTRNLFVRDVEPLLDALRHLACSFTHRAADADDLLQETLLRAWVAPYCDVGTAAGWLAATMRTAWIDTLRKRRRHGGGSSHVALTASIEERRQRLFGDGRWDDVEKLQRAIAMLRALPKPQRQALMRVEVRGESYRRAARAERTRTGTVKSRVNRAKVRLSAARGELS